MKKKNEIIWRSDFAKKVFHDVGINNAEKFWKLEEGDIDCEFIDIKKKSSYGGKNLYSIVYMKINKSKYRLKRASGKYFTKLMNERRMMKAFPELHITPPLVTAYSVDEKNRQCFFLFKYPPGFIVMKNLLEYKLHPTVIADFDVRKKAVMKKISKIIHKMHYCDYFYPYWYSDHLMVKNQSDEIAIIDLEDFLHLKDLPWYYRLELCSYLVRQKQWRTLRKNFASGIFTKKYMKSLLK